MSLFRAIGRNLKTSLGIQNHNGFNFKTLVRSSTFFKMSFWGKWFFKGKLSFKYPETLIWRLGVSVPFQYASLSPAISRAKDQLLFFVVKLNQSWTTTSTRYSVLNNGVKRYLKIYLHVIITMCKYENGSLLLWNCTNWIENWMLFSKRLKPIIFGYTTPFGIPMMHNGSMD